MGKRSQYTRNRIIFLCLAITSIVKTMNLLQEEGRIKTSRLLTLIKWECLIDCHASSCNIAYYEKSTKLM